MAIGALLIVGLAGCSAGTAGDVASVTKPSATSTANPPLKSDDKGAALKFAQCMRDQGIDMQDPDTSGGGLSIAIPEGTDRGKADAAMEKCKKYLPNGGDAPRPSADQIQENVTYAKCMRDNGVKNFPDPGADGGIMIDQSSGIDPQSPAFQKAEKICHPNGAGNLNMHVEQGNGK